jgi:type IV pilus assembly protein PilV
MRASTALAMHANRRKSAGFSLVEAMVSLIVISVGMIGIAALYGQGLSAGRTALSRTIAVNLAATMAENIRVNRLGQAAYAGAGADNNCDPAGGGGVDCTPAQMAAHDLFLWNADVAAQLPNGVGAVAFVDGTPPNYTITVTWDEVGIGQVTETLTVQVPTI